MQNPENRSARNNLDESRDQISADRRVENITSNHTVTDTKTDDSEQWASNKIAKRNFAIATLALVVAIVGIFPLNVLFTPEGGIRSVIEDEAKLTVTGELDGVTNLFLPDASIRDEAGGNEEEAKTWIGMKEIKKRYDQLGKFTELSHNDIEIFISHDWKYANVKSSTLGKYYLNGEEIVISGYSIDRDEEWSLKRVGGWWIFGGTWKIKKFTYNLP